MSYPGVDPADTVTMNPVAQQEVSVGEHNPLFRAKADELHDDALRGQINPDALKNAVVEAVTQKLDQFAISDSWIKKEQIQFVIECPSGQRCLAKHLNTMDLVEADLIEEVDYFTKNLFPSSFDAAGNPVEAEEDRMSTAFWTTLKDPEKKARFFTLLNKLLSISIVKPRVVDDGVELVTDEYGEKTVKFGGKARPLAEGEVYASAIDFSDKIIIFGELNKPLEQIKPFREE